MSQQKPSPEPMAAFFDARVNGYDEHMRSSLGADFEPFYAAIAGALPVTDEPIRILDLGCGTGAELEWILQRAPQARLTCVDMSEGMLAKLKERYAAQRDQITVVQASYLDYEFGARQYDYVLSAMTMHHFTYEVKTALYARICAALKPGGAYVEGDYYVDLERETAFLQRRQGLLADLGDSAGLYHIDIPFAEETQVSLLQTAGFGPVEQLWRYQDWGVLMAMR